MLLLSSLEPLVREVEQQLGQLSTDPLYKAQATLLIHLPGMGMLSAMVVLSAIGDITASRVLKS